MGSVILLIMLFALYWLPTGVALARKTDNVAQVAVMNFFGFTLVFWVVSLVFAVKPLPDRPKPIKHSLTDWGRDEQ